MAGIESVEKRVRKGWLLGLIKIMYADGHADPKEVLLVEKRRIQWGLTIQDVEDVQRNPDAYPYIPPSTDKERVVAMLDFMALMMIDGDINPREVECCHSAAKVLGIPPQFVDYVVQKVRTAILSKTPRASQEQEILDFLQQN